MHIDVGPADRVISEMIGFDIGNAVRIDAARFFTIFPVSVRVPRMRGRRYQRYRRGTKRLNRSLEVVNTISVQSAPS